MPPSPALLLGPHPRKGSPAIFLGGHAGGLAYTASTAGRWVREDPFGSLHSCFNVGPPVRTRWPRAGAAPAQVCASWKTLTPFKRDTRHLGHGEGGRRARGKGGAEKRADFVQSQVHGDLERNSGAYPWALSLSQSAGELGVHPPLPVGPGHERPRHSGSRCWAAPIARSLEENFVGSKWILKLGVGAQRWVKGPGDQGAAPPLPQACHL